MSEVAESSFYLKKSTFGFPTAKSKEYSGKQLVFDVDGTCPSVLIASIF